MAQGPKVAPAAEVNRRPRPRAIALGIDGAEADRLLRIFPTLNQVTSLAAVEQIEYDVLITGVGIPDTVSDHLFVLARDRTETPVQLGYVQIRERARVRAKFELGSRAREFLRPELPAPIADLVRTVVEPSVLEGTSQRVLVFTLYGLHGIGPIDWTSAGVRPFILTSDNSALAGSFVREGGTSSCWALPRFVPDLLPWAALAVREWREIAPERFPSDPDWKHSMRWATTEELSLVREIAVLQIELERVQDSFRARLTSMSQKLKDTQRERDNEQRLLLTSQSERLVGAVATALAELGFGVESIDATGRSEKVEDLRLTDPIDHSWVALAEVKGYSAGAKAGDLQQISKFEAIFAIREGRLPSACWYIVNHGMTEDPLTRRPALQGAEDHLGVFAAGGGLVLDSRVLFDLWADVQAGALSPDDARRLLRGTTGRVDYAPKRAIDTATSSQAPAARS